MVRCITAAALAAIALFGLSSCGTPSISEEDLEQTVSDRLEAQVGQKPDEIECPEDLAAKVGEKVRCTLTAGGDEIGVTVTVTKVDGTRANFDIEVDEG